MSSPECLDLFKERKYRVKPLSKEVRERKEKRKRGELKMCFGDLPDATEIYGKPTKKDPGKMLRLIFRIGVGKIKRGVNHHNSGDTHREASVHGPRWLFKDDYDEYDAGDIRLLKGRAITHMREIQEEAEEMGYEFFINDPDEGEFIIQIRTEEVK